MRRREFFIESGRAALGMSFAPFSTALQSHQAPSAARAQTPKNLIKDLETEIPDLMNAAQVPAVSIALVRDGALFWRRGFGVKDIRSKARVDEHTTFEAASTTKPVFAYAVMKLRERGVLDLDTPLTTYTSERILEGDPRLDLITARHVLSHTSGLPNWRSKTQPMAIAFSPGEQWRYSGEGYSYLQAVVTRLTGSRVDQRACGKFELGVQVCATDPVIDEYMQGNVLRPFRMRSSGFMWTREMEANIARGHDPKGRPLVESRKPTGPAVARYGMAGGLCTTPTDYARFLMQVISPQPADAFRLTHASLVEMLRPHVTHAPQRSWALGWEISHTETGDFIRHGGLNPGYSCFVAGSVARQTGCVIMTNSEENGAVGVIDKLIAGDTLSGFLGGKLQA